MTKQEMTQLLRSVGVNENTITAMENAYEMGFESARQQCVNLTDSFYEDVAGQTIPSIHLLTLAEVITSEVRP